MSSETNRVLVRESFERWTQGRGGPFDLLADDVIWTGVVPAIGNAIFNATGRRLRSLPFTPDKLIEAGLHG